MMVNGFNGRSTICLDSTENEKGWLLFHGIMLSENEEICIFCVRCSVLRWICECVVVCGFVVSALPVLFFVELF